MPNNEELPTSKGYLRTALANIHEDPNWWRTVLLGGGAMLTLVGWPLASGLVIESIDNSRKGYPTPLPPWIDLGTRYMIGLLALLIDFVLFVMPGFVGVALLVCIILGTLLGAGTSGNREAFTTLSTILLGLMATYELGVFLSSASPVARLVYVEDGRIEDAIGAGPARQALSAPGRGFYARARLSSLLVYLPTLLLAVAVWSLFYTPFPGRVVVIILLVWLMLSALLYAQLAVAQIYVLAEQEREYAAMQSHMPR